MSQNHTIAVTIGVTPGLEMLIDRALDVLQGQLSVADAALLDDLLLRAAGITSAEEALAAETPPKS